MNWKRGLIRAWVLFTVIWILSIGTIATYNFREGVAGPGSSADYDTTIDEMVKDGQLPALPKGAVAVPRVALAEAPHPNISLWPYVLLALGVPLVILGAGAGTWWVVSGFRSRSSN